MTGGQKTKTITRLDPGPRDMLYFFAKENFYEEITLKNAFKQGIASLQGFFADSFDSFSI